MGHHTLVAVLACPALALAVQAEVVHVDLSPGVQFILGNRLDINRDGTADIELYAQEGWMGPDGAEYHWYWADAYALGAARISAARLAFGELVSAATPMGTSLRASGSEHQHGPGGFFRFIPGSPTDTTPTYFGFSFEPTPGVTHYGWVRYQIYELRADLIHRTRVLDYAWETTPGVPITVPTPGALLSLAVLAASYRGRRSR